MNLKKAKEVLGITKEDFSKKDIDKAYRKLALIWHTDKPTPIGYTKEQQEEKFKEISEANKFLLNYLEGEKKEWECYWCDDGLVFSKKECDDWIDHKILPTSDGPKKGKIPRWCHCPRCGIKITYLPGTVIMNVSGLSDYDFYLCMECDKIVKKNPDCQICGKRCRFYPLKENENGSICSHKRQCKVSNEGLGHGGGANDEWQKYNQSVQNNFFLIKLNTEKTTKNFLKISKNIKKLQVI